MANIEYEEILNHSFTGDETLAILANLSNSSDKEFLEKILNHPKTDKLALSMLAWKGGNDNLFFDKILNHEKITDTVLSFVVEGSNDISVHMKVFNHPKVSDEALAAIAGKCHKNILRQIFEHPNVDDRTLNILAYKSSDNNDYAFHEKILKHPRIGLLTLNTLANNIPVSQKVQALAQVHLKFYTKG